jgi:integral membrane protein (TIGR01906 family)
MDVIRGATAALVIGVATAIVVIAVAILPFLSPAWVGFEQERAQAAAWTGYSPADLHAATDAILGDLVLGPPVFDVEVAGAPVLSDRERGHMRDVRSVLMAFYLVAAIAALVLVAGLALARGRARAALWRRLSRAGIVIALVTVVGGLAGVASFDAAFELFHEIFFPQGNFLFDPRTDRLVQLFPESFWVETTIAIGAVIVVVSIALAWLGRRRASSIEARSAGTPPTLSAVPVR